MIEMIEIIEIIEIIKKIKITKFQIEANNTEDNSKKLQSRTIVPSCSFLFYSYFIHLIIHLMRLQCKFLMQLPNATSMRLQCDFNATSMQLQCDFNATFPGRMFPRYQNMFP